MIAAILLAAGRSQRMGAPKLLLPVGGVPLLARVADAFPRPSVDQLVVVTQPGAADLRAALAGRPVEWVENPDPQGDMLSSVRCGLRALPPAAHTVLVTPADMPGLNAALIAALLVAHRHSGHGILVPVFRGRRGHPLVFSAAYIAEIQASFEGVGLRGLMQAHAAEVAEWPAPSPAVLHDLDTPEDYQAWLAGT